MTELALAEWGLARYEVSTEELEGLTLAWMRRKRFEARLIALEVGRLFASDGTRERSPEEMWELLERVA